MPVSTAVQTFLPIVLEPLFLHEHWGSASYYGLPLAGGLAVALAGVVLVAGSHEVSELVAAASLPDEARGADDDEHKADPADQNGSQRREPGVDLAAHAAKPRA